MTAPHTSPWLRVAKVTLLPGQSAGLDERTAVIEVEVGDTPVFDAEVQARLRSAAAALKPPGPAHGTDESDFPTSFLVPFAPAADADAECLAHWVIALTVAIQRWGNDAVRGGKVLTAEPHRLRLAIGWTRQDFFTGSLDAALDLLQDWLGPTPTARPLADFFAGRWEAFRSSGLSVNTQAFIRAAVARDIPFDVLPSYVQLGWGCAAERIDQALTGHTGWIATAASRNRPRIGRTLAAALVPAPEGRQVSTVEEALQAAQELGWPVVTKPADRRPAVSTTAGIADESALRTAVEKALGCGVKRLLVEQHVAGGAHRLLIVRDRLLLAVRCPSTGEPDDVTAAVHPENVALARRAARIIGLDIAGVRLRISDVTRSWREVGGMIYDVEAQPALEPYWRAAPDRDLEGEILDVLFDGRPARIPTAAIAGTNGKTTTSTMLHRIWSAAGRRTGTCTTTQVVIGDQVISQDNLSGYPGGRLILNDPGVQAAVLEMPRKGLIVFGHPCDRYDVAALINVQDDHLGEFGIDTLEQMAELKAEVLRRATTAIVVNAEDPLCMAMRSRARTDRHILVAHDPAAVGDHRRNGSEAVTLTTRDGQTWIVLCRGDSETLLMPVAEIPATMNGLLRCNETNAMFAAALAWAQGIDPAVIRAALAGFDNSVEQNPGRYNFVEGLPFGVLLDFAHNPDGVRELCAVAAAMPVIGRRIACVVNLGNSQPRKWPAVADRMGETFDDIIVGPDAEEVMKCPRYAAEADPIAAMLTTARDALTAAGVDESRITTVPGREEAILEALRRAGDGDLVVILAHAEHGLPVIEKFLANR